MYDRVAFENQFFTVQSDIPAYHDTLTVLQGQVFLEDALKGSGALIDIVELAFNGVENYFECHVFVTVLRLSLAS